MMKKVLEAIGYFMQGAALFGVFGAVALLAWLAF